MRFDSDESHDGDVEFRGILLILEILVSGQENLELGCRQLKQLTVRLRRPSPFGNRYDLMPREVPPEVLRKRLIEEKLHRPPRAGAVQRPRSGPRHRW